MREKTLGIFITESDKYPHLRLSRGIVALVRWRKFREALPGAVGVDRRMT